MAWGKVDGVTQKLWRPDEDVTVVACLDQDQGPALPKRLPLPQLPNEQRWGALQLPLQLTSYLSLEPGDR